MSERANYNCPSCESSDLFRKKGNTFECENCGQQVHEAVADNADVLNRLQDREDKAGEIAEKLLETGGVDQ